MNNSSHFVFTSNWKDPSELDQLAKQVSSFLFPKRRFSAWCRTAQTSLSVTLWKDGEHYFLLYLTKELMKSEQIGSLLDVLSASLDQIGIPLEQVRSRMTLNLFAQDFEMGFLERVRLIMPKVETHSWMSAHVEQKEFVMLKEAKSPFRTEEKKKGFTEDPRFPGSFLADNLSDAELSEFARLGSDLRKVQG